MMPNSPVKLLLVDDHQVVRLGLRALFETVPQAHVVGEAGSVEGALAEVDRCEPDVVMLDVRLPDGSGVEACREIRSRRPDVQVIMLTSYSDEDAVVASIIAGAAGYLLKEADAERMIEAVAVVAQGGSLLDPHVTQTVLQRMRRLATHTDDDPIVQLSEQERNILPLIAQGKTNRQIGADLSLSEHTVKTYISHILRKLNFTRRAEAAAFIASRQRPASP